MYLNMKYKNGVDGVMVAHLPVTQKECWGSIPPLLPLKKGKKYNKL